MDHYDAALRRLRADSRTPGQLSKEIDVPAGTLRDIKQAICTNPRWQTLRKIKAYYFPKTA